MKSVTELVKEFKDCVNSTLDRETKAHEFKTICEEIKKQTGEFGLNVRTPTEDPKKNESLLHFLARKRYVDGVVILLMLGASMDIKDSDGLTPSERLWKERKKGVFSIETFIIQAIFASEEDISAGIEVYDNFFEKKVNTSKFSLKNSPIKAIGNFFAEKEKIQQEKMKERVLHYFSHAYHFSNSIDTKDTAILNGSKLYYNEVYDAISKDGRKIKHKQAILALMEEAKKLEPATQNSKSEINEKTRLLSNTERGKNLS